MGKLKNFPNLIFNGHVERGKKKESNSPPTNGRRRRRQRLDLKYIFDKYLFIYKYKSYDETVTRLANNFPPVKEILFSV